MKIIHVPYTFAPDPSGGTEGYVESLTRCLSVRGYKSEIAAPGAREETYGVRGTIVHRFTVSSSGLRLSELYGEGDPTAAASFEQLVDRLKPDIVHFHAFSPAVSVRLARWLEKRHIPMVFTYHTPTVSCQRGTLLEFGWRDCDGKLDVGRCSRCVLRDRIAWPIVAHVIAETPAHFGAVMRRHGLEGGIWTGLRTRELMTVRQAVTREWLAKMHRIVAPSRWVRDLLLENGVPQEKIVVSAQGTTRSRSISLPQQRTKGTESGLRIAALARLHPTKGLHILLEAVAMLGAAPLALDIYGIVQTSPNDAYVRRLRALAAKLPGVRMCAPITGDDVIPTLSRYDALAVPSIWKETGPIVVLEAFAAGIPVIGSELGGIRERVRHGVDGLLVSVGSVPAWTTVLKRLLDDPALLWRLRAGVRPPRTMEKAADDMVELYRELSTSRQRNGAPAEIAT